MTQHGSLLRAAVLPLLLASSTLLPAQAKKTKAIPSNVAKYIGPGSCSAVACHGGVAPSQTTSVLQNEYSTWVVKDRHSQAYRVLENQVSKRMARILGIGDPTSAGKCLACHALHVPRDQRGRDFETNEGVSCESCHGPASQWLGNHTLRDWTRPQSVAQGMYDTSDLIKRSEKCLSCHLGTAEKFVDHEMIAAGHPDLVFDLDAYSDAMPPHWKPDPDPLAPMRTMAVGQAVKLRESLRRLSRRVNGPVWPEYAELDCFSCHHPIGRPDTSWRQARGYHGRRPGNAPWNAAHYVVLRIIAKEIDGNDGKRLESGLEQVFKLASALQSDKEALSSAADSTAEIANALARELNTARLTKGQAERLLRALTAESDRIASEGPRAAEQATMAMESLAIVHSGKTSPLRDSIRQLLPLLEAPSTYSGPRFAAEMKKVRSLIR